MYGASIFSMAEIIGHALTDLSKSLATSLFVATTYNDWQAKKQKRPRLDRSALEAQALLSLVAKPIIGGNEWRTVREDVESRSHSNDGLLQVPESCL